MIVVKIFSGLGNQLFQYAAGYHLAKRFNCALYLELSDYKFNRNRVFKLFDLNFETKKLPWHFKFLYPIYLSRYQHRLRWLLKIFPFKYYFEENHKYAKELPLCNNIYLEGYFQFYDHILDYRSYFSQQINEKLSKVYLENLNDSEVPIALHIRRGDYLNNTSFHNVSIDYYNRAIDYIDAHFTSFGYLVKYYFFSDDIDWAERTFSAFGSSKEFVKGNDDVTDFLLMMKCTGFIIPNSTFSWWPAFLSDAKYKLVILPKYWFKDIESDNFALDDWIKIPN